MYLISLPLLDFIGQLGLNYAERLDMIKSSLLFKSCRRNILCSYLLFLLEVVSFSMFVVLLSGVSLNLIPFGNIHGLGIVLFVFYFSVTFGIYSFIDKDDYRSRIRG